MARFPFQRHLLSTAVFILILPAIAAAVPEVIAGKYLIERKKAMGATTSSSDHYTVVQSGAVVDLVMPKRSSGGPGILADDLIVPLDPQVVAEDCGQIKKDPSVALCEPSFISYNTETIPNDTDFNLQLGLLLPAFDGASQLDIRATQAWDFSTGSSDVVVAVIDSGIRATHIDIINNLWTNPAEVPGDGVDNDFNGYIDDVIGIDAKNLTGDPADCNGHGSHVAGIIGAEGNNSEGISGVVWDVQIMSIRNAFDCGSSVSISAVITGLEYVMEMKRRGVNIVAVNASFGGGPFSQALFNAVQRLKAYNIVFVAAAGNNHLDNDADPFFPASFDLSHVVSVASVNNISAPNVLSSFSNYGATSVDLAAPGDVIRSLSQLTSNSYIERSGTSMATPMVVGAIALLKSFKPQFNTPDIIVDRLLNTGSAADFLSGKTKSGAMLNLVTLLSAPEPADACPLDSAKLAPGICGCGVADTYGDSDNDRTLDCLDACAADPQKTSPGLCGCGNSDKDSDSDGSPDCQDTCASDSAKTSPGTCGCGVSDQDANANGAADCFDAQISSSQPPAPKTKIDKKKKKVVITMTPSSTPGAQLVLSIVSKTKKGKKTVTKTKIKANAQAITKIAIPAPGTQLLISYMYQIPGPSIFTSAQSQSKSIRG